MWWLTFRWVVAAPPGCPSGPERCAEAHERWVCCFTYHECEEGDVRDANCPTRCPPAYPLVCLPQAIEETGAYFKVKPVVIDRVAHDCMLDTVEDGRH